MFENDEFLLFVFMNVIYAQLIDMEKLKQSLS